LAPTRVFELEVGLAKQEKLQIELGDPIVRQGLNGFESVINQPNEQHPASPWARTGAPGLTPECGRHNVLRKDKVEIGNSGHRVLRPLAGLGLLPQAALACPPLRSRKP
jgi:hypothetical protein